MIGYVIGKCVEVQARDKQYKGKEVVRLYIRQDGATERSGADYVDGLGELIGDVEVGERVMIRALIRANTYEGRLYESAWALDVYTAPELADA